MKEKQFEGNDTTRRKEQQPLLYWMTVVTLVIIVIAFVIFPAIDGGFSSSSTNAVATFMGEKIPGDYYSLYAANIQGLNNYLEQEVSNGKIDPQMVQLYFNFYKNEILNQTAEVVAISKLLKDKGIQKSASRIETLMRQNCGDPQLGIMYRIDNSKAPSKVNFSEKKYKEAIAKNPLQVKAIRKNLTLRDNAQYFYSDLNSLTSKNEKFEQFLNEAAQKRYSCSYFKLDQDMILDDLLIPFIEKKSDDYIQLNLQVIRCDDKKTIKEIALEVKEDPELFSERAKQYQATGISDSEGNLEGFANDLFSQLNCTKQATKSLLLSLQEHEISDILNIDGYFYLFKANSMPLAQDINTIIAQHKSTILDSLKENENQNFVALMQETANTLYQEALKDGFETVAQNYEAEIQKIEKAPINYKNTSFLPQATGDVLYDNKTLLSELATINEPKLLAPVSYQDDIYLFYVDLIESVSDNQISFDQNNLISQAFRNWVVDPSRFTSFPINE